MLQEKDLYWLAGLLEGEGYFQPKRKSSPVIALEITDEDIIQRVCKLIGTTYCKPKIRKQTHRQSFKTTLKGKRAIDLMTRKSEGTSISFEDADFKALQQMVGLTQQ